MSLRARHVVSAALVVTLLIDEGAAQAEPTADAGDVTSTCLAAFEAAQLRRLEGKPLAASRGLETCAADACPGIVRRKCQEWLPEEADAVPRVIVTVSEHDGSAVAAAIRLDDELVDGNEVLLMESGRHHLRVQHDDGRVAARAFLVTRGQTRAFRFELPALVSEPEPSVRPRRPAPAAPPPVVEADADARLWGLVIGGFSLGGAALLVGTVSGGLAIARDDELDVSCAAVGPEACSQEDIDDALRLAHVSTVGFAVAGGGVVTGAIALAVWLSADDTIASSAVTVRPLVSLDAAGYPYIGVSGSY